MIGCSWSHDLNASSLDSSQLQIPAPLSAFNNSDKNIFCLLARREISPRTRHTTKRHWGEVYTLKPESSPGSDREAEYDARRSLFSWVEAESLRHLNPIYCPLMPPPRSTIAAAFSPDGRTLASTHGDHTVKIIHCATGNCLKVLSGHRRTPWVVRFHPLCPEILASGSLDHEVRLWDANTSDCLVSRDFYRPIASIAFHAKGELLAVASGHKLYMWHYNNRGEGSSPAMILKTKRSLRAVHFHPHGAPFLLTAEVNDLGTSDSSLMRATSPGYLQYPPPAVFLANVHSTERPSTDSDLPLTYSPFLFLPSYPKSDSSVDLQQNTRILGQSSAPFHSSQLQLQPFHNPGEQSGEMLFPMDTSPAIPSTSYPGTEAVINYFPNEMHNVIGDPTLNILEAAENQPVEPDLSTRFSELDSLLENTLFVASGGSSYGLDPIASLYLNNRDMSSLERPFLHGWLMGENQSGAPMFSLNSSAQENSSRNLELNYETWTRQNNQDPTLSLEHAAQSTQVPEGSIAVPLGYNLSDVSGSSSVRERFPHLHVASQSDSRDDTTGSHHSSHIGNDIQPIVSAIPDELVAPVTAEVPCTVKLRLWPYDVKDPCAPLNSDRCRLCIPHAVLCSEMGAHFSPCGRYLAVCVACALPHTEPDPVLPMNMQYESTGAATSPTRHPVSAHQLIYELRIYSLEEATFGIVLISRAIRAAHCLTSIQFSPTSEHILLAYGRRHSSLLKSVVIDGEKTMPIYTILEVYRVSDMELVRVLPSAVDEVNVACFHPLPGGGLVYGTKEGRLRIFHYDGPLGMDLTGTNFVIEKNIVELLER